MRTLIAFLFTTCSLILLGSCHNPKQPKATADSEMDCNMENCNCSSNCGCSDNCPCK